MLLSCQIWRSNQHLKIFYKVKRRREFIFNYLERGFVWLFTQFNNETIVMQSLLSKEETTWRIIPRTVIDTCGVKSSACKIVLHVHRYNSKINQKIRIISEQKKSLVFTCNHLSVKIIVEDLRFNCETIRRENSESQGEMKKIGEHRKN